MPRRRPVGAQDCISNIFVVLVSWVISIIYYAYVFLVWLPQIEGKYKEKDHIFAQTKMAFVLIFNR